MISKKTLSFVMVALGVGTYFAAMWSRNESPELAFREAISPCHFTSPGERVEGGMYQRGVRYCPGVPKLPYLALMEHMRLSARPSDEAMIAAEFGSLVRLMYLPGVAFMFNPVAFDTGDSEMVTCEDEIGGQVVERLRPNKVRLEFVNGDFHPQSMVLSGGQACLTQSILEIL
jgi:hypothetical protein